jgi:hypothetical protein
MTTRILNRGYLYAKIVCELFRYDLLFALGGLKSVRPRPLARTTVALGNTGLSVGSEIYYALAAVAPFYWKPIRCLQRSIVIARLLRSRGVAAEVVIGYQPAPFFSHAWVEVDTRIIGDSEVYRRRLLQLERF